jgi:subtilase family serine protease
MKKTLIIVALSFSFLLAFAPLSLGSNGKSSSSDFNYLPFVEYSQAGSVSVSPSGIPYCFTSSHLAITCYTPQDIRTAYNFPPDLNGSGETILIVDAYGSPTIQADLASFDALFNISAPPSFTVLCPPGGCASKTLFGAHDIHGVEGWAIETSLDVEYAHAMAPGANIVLVVAASSSGNAINAAEAKAIQMYPGSIMSQSFGIPEYLVSGNNAQVIQAEHNFAVATSEGITVLASAGDSGATNGVSFPNANFPASDPLITSVGGTQGYPYLPFGVNQSCSGGPCSSGLVTVSGTCNTNHTLTSPACTPVGYGGEQVWNEPVFGGATGGAPSLIFGTPVYQEALGVTSRATPDVSYNAAIDGGVLVYTSFLGGEAIFFVGGTSAGSPQWAAIIAIADQLAGHPLGFVNPTIYAIGQNLAEYSNDFHDITVGNNTLVGTPAGFTAGTGWDDASGWGTPNVANLVTDLAA